MSRAGLSANDKDHISSKVDSSRMISPKKSLILAALLLGGVVDATAVERRSPSQSCERERADCLRAHSREGAFGSRYVPPEEGAECQAAYQACKNPDPCARERKACLRGAVRRTTTGAEYVPPEDVARCLEAYDACRSRNGATSGATAQPKGGEEARTSKLPPMKRFEIRSDAGQGVIISDCRISNNAVDCSTTWENLPSHIISFSGAFTGVLSGSVLTGVATSHIKTHDTVSGGCINDEDYQGPATYQLDADGTARLKTGPNKRQSKFSGACRGGNSGVTNAAEVGVKWRVLE